MTALPRVLYLLQALPIRLPLLSLSKSIRCSAILSGRTENHVLNCNFFTWQNTKGGIGLPDVKAYYRATHLTRVVDWHCHAEAKQWVAMELEDSDGTAKSWPWITTPIPKAIVAHPTLGSTIQVARDAFRHSSVSPIPSPMVPIPGNPDFLPGCRGPVFRYLTAEGRWPHLHDFLGPTGQLTADAGMPGSDPPLDFLSGLQLRNFLRRCARTPGILRQLTELEQICHRKEPTHHCLSLIYSSLISPAEGFMPPFLSKWEEELGVQFTKPQREKILHFAQKSSLATRVQETC